nr:DUF2846 domain-containing protein [Acinetobacter sp. Marseille-Q1620]
MRYLSLVLIGTIVLAGCQSHKVANEKKSNLISTLKPVNLDKDPSILDQYGLSGFSTGSWVNQEYGQYFKLVQPQNPEAAVVYFYRPDSKWNRQEIIAPNFYINDRRIPSLISNHYYWIELPEGTYRLTINRPLTVVKFQKPRVVDFSVIAGKQYFIKYEEEQFRGGPNGDGAAELLRSGPIMQMPTKQALKEIGMTQLKTPGLNFVATIDEQGRVVKSKEQIKGQKYKASDDVHLVQPFKIWNPLTW